MNTDADYSAGATGQPPASGQQQPGPQEPPAIQIKMPKPGASRQPGEQQQTQAGSIEAVEDLLRKLMHRLDENDRHYGAALEDLNHRLNNLSERAQTARGGQPRGAGAALDRVRDQAMSLAEQVSEAGAAYQTRRSGEYAGANDDTPPPSFGNEQLNENFADMTQRLERALAERAPAGDFGALSQRMDDLARRFDAALATKSDLAALQSIESQLNALTAGFAEAQQTYDRVAAIEGHLRELINRSYAGGGADPQGAGGDRLASIEETLTELNENTREMDARTVRTLEAMNEALHSLAANVGKPETVVPGGGANTREETARAPQDADMDSGSDEYAEVWFEQKPEAEPAPQPPADTPQPSADHYGASIPDYRPPAGKAQGAQPATPQDYDAPQQAIPGERTEPVFDSRNDFIESARRAAAAAAQDTPAKPANPARRMDGLLAGLSGSAESPEKKRTRPLLVFAAVALLLVSAALLYVRLSRDSQPPQTDTPAQTAPKPPETSASPPEESRGNGAGKPEAPESGGDAQRSGSIAPDADTANPSGITRPAPATAPRQGSAATASRTGGSPQPASDIGPGRAVSTATLLASLKPDSAGDRMPGVSTAIMEPAANTSAARADNIPAGESPALVPQESGSGQAPMAMPRRAPAPAPEARKPDGYVNVDSARAREVTPSDDAVEARMPPAKIGPHSLRIAAARGNPQAQVEVGSRFAKGTGVPKDIEKAAEWYRRAASRGHAPGQYRLAALYERGQGVKKNAQMARTWYRRAAELGNVRAMHNLAVLYTREDSGKADYQSAKNWFYQAARHGLADSQFNLGILYENGLGTRQNIAEAYKWYTLAARQGDEEARKRREAVRPKLPAKSLAAAESVLRKWKAAPVQDSANRTGPPRGGWANAEAGTNAKTGDPARIARAQFLLNKHGFDAGAPDGKFGPQTLAAVRAFEKKAGVPSSGRVTPILLQKLEAYDG